MRIVTDENGDVCTLPHDAGFDFAIPVKEWILKRDSLALGFKPFTEANAFLYNDIKDSENEHLLSIMMKYRIYKGAVALYRAASSPGEPLRRSPVVIPSFQQVEKYDWHPEIELLFLFQEDNNGATYKVYHTLCQGDYPRLEGGWGFEFLELFKCYPKEHDKYLLNVPY